MQEKTTARLSEFAELGVLRDGEFATLGFVAYPQQGMLAFAESKRFLDKALSLSEVSCLIVAPDLSDLVPAGRGLAVASNPRLAFGGVHNALARNTSFYGATRPSEISPDAVVHPRAYVADINVCIGRRSRIGANASVLEGTIIGDDVTVDEGAVIGARGLQVGLLADTASDLEHTGRVRLDDGVIVSANCVIARGLFHGETHIGQHVRIGNLSFVSHSVTIGARAIVGHGVTISGHTRIGDGVFIGPGATISDGLKIGAGARVTLGSVVVKDVAGRGHVSGNFAVKHSLFLRRQQRGIR